MRCRHTSDLALTPFNPRTVFPAKAAVLTSPEDLLRNRLQPAGLCNTLNSGLECVRRRIRRCVELLLLLVLASDERFDDVVSVIDGIVLLLLLAFLKSVALLGLGLELELVAWMS